MEISDTELMLLGLVAEMPRHGYELEQVIVHRAMREWTAIGFSSIYFLLGKLQKRGLIRAYTSRASNRTKAQIPGADSQISDQESEPNTKPRKVFTVSKKGMRILKNQALRSLREISAHYSSLTRGLLQWPFLSREEALAALQDRLEALRSEEDRLSGLQLDQQPLPDYENAMYDFALSQIESEYEWVKRTTEYMETKPWN